MISFKQFYEAAKTPKGNYMSIGVDASLVLPGFVPPKTGTEVPLNKQHVTLIYSQTSEIPPEELLDKVELTFPRVDKVELTFPRVDKVELTFPREIVAEAYEFAAFDSLPKNGERDSNEATLVVKLRSDFLNKIHDKLKELGCSHSYPEYSAHVSLYYGVDRNECHLLVKMLNRIVKLPTHVRLSGYKSDQIIDDWVKKM